MNSSSSTGKLGFEFTFGGAAGAPREPDAPFAILVLADLSGRANRGVREALGGRRIQAVDCDNEDSVFAGFKASLTMPPLKAPAAPTTLTFESLDDFHPDQ